MKTLNKAISNITPFDLRKNFVSAIEEGENTIALVDYFYYPDDGNISIYDDKKKYVFSFEGEIRDSDELIKTGAFDYARLVKENKIKEEFKDIPIRYEKSSGNTTPSLEVDFSDGERTVVRDFFVLCAMALKEDSHNNIDLIIIARSKAVDCTAEKGSVELEEMWGHYLSIKTNYSKADADDLLSAYDKALISVLQSGHFTKYKDCDGTYMPDMVEGTFVVPFREDALEVFMNLDLSDLSFIVGPPIAEKGDWMLVYPNKVEFLEEDEEE